MAKMFLLAGFFLLLIISSCSFPKRSHQLSFEQRFGVADSSYYPSYSKGFAIHYFGIDKLIELPNPWDQTLPAEYFLINNSKTLEFRNVPSIEAPVSNWSAFSSSQVVMAEILDVLATLKSVAEPEYISNQFVREGLQHRDIKNVGLASAPDMELLILSRPGFVFVSPFKDNSYEQLREAGLVVVPDAGYLETTPLGRVEWLVLFGAFFNKEEEAYAYFKEAARKYNEVTLLTSGIVNRPSMTTGYLFQNIWFLPAGDSYLATLFKDAGAFYPYESVPGYGSLAYDFEKVFHDTHNSDYWVLTVNHPGNFSYEDLKLMDMRYADFKAFHQRKIICSNTGFSRYFEQGWIEPHTVVKDLASVFHPALFPNHQPVYFELMP